jgi:tetrapyrrole methylase family protein / MazG family protein
MKPEKLKETNRLLEVVHQLRKDCPWDRKQTHKSLIPYLIEEAYEAVSAIEEKSRDNLREELGDLLLQIVLHSEISDEKGQFDFEDVAKSITEKMIRRHPHIFGDAEIKSAKAQTKHWSKLKSLEKPDRSLLSGLPKALPALQLAQRYGEIAASVGFDWKNATDVLEKVNEELEELIVEIKRRPRRQSALEMELGDLLFTLTRLAGHLSIDSERALRKSSQKFEERFGELEKEMKSRGKLLSDCKLPEMEEAWQKIKKKHR